MNGGLSVISDVPKMMVYRISKWINREREIIPAASITKAPSGTPSSRSNIDNAAPCRPILRSQSEYRRWYMGARRS